MPWDVITEAPYEDLVRRLRRESRSHSYPESWESYHININFDDLRKFVSAQVNFGEAAVQPDSKKAEKDPVRSCSKEVDEVKDLGERAQEAEDQEVKMYDRRWN